MSGDSDPLVGILVLYSDRAWHGVDELDARVHASLCFDFFVASHAFELPPFAPTLSLPKTTSQAERGRIAVVQLRGYTYTRELDAAVTTFRCSSLLLDVEVSELATGGLDYADLVGHGVVAAGGSIVRSVSLQVVLFCMRLWVWLTAGGDATRK